MRPRAFLFDFDGVLVDTEPVHLQAWLDVLARRRIFFSKEDYYERYLGLNDRDFLAKLFQEKGYPWTADLSQTLIGQKATCSLNLLQKDIPQIDGADLFLRETLAGRPSAIVTGALKSEVTFILEQLHWEKFFVTVVAAEDVVKGKPDPEGYLKAFVYLQKELSWNPPLRKEECLILEDSPYGVEAARRAGIPYRCVRGRLSASLLADETHEC